jgi:hypothetical protein
VITLHTNVTAKASVNAPKIATVGPLPIVSHSQRTALPGQFKPREFSVSLTADSSRNCADNQVNMPQTATPSAGLSSRSTSKLIKDGWEGGALDVMVSVWRANSGALLGGDDSVERRRLEWTGDATRAVSRRASTAAADTAARIDPSAVTRDAPSDPRVDSRALASARP